MSQITIAPVSYTHLVDRIDRLLADGSLGVVDYKSSETKFSYEKFFNGLNSQLPTYLAAIQELQGQQESRDLFGAMYLQMTEPIAVSYTHLDVYKRQVVSWTIISRIFARKFLEFLCQPLLVWAINWVEIRREDCKKEFPAD